VARNLGKWRYIIFDGLVLLDLKKMLSIISLIVVFLNMKSFFYFSHFAIIPLLAGGKPFSAEFFRAKDPSPVDILPRGHLYIPIKIDLKYNSTPAF
jgi:hypothetical protein